MRAYVQMVPERAAYVDQCEVPVLSRCQHVTAIAKFIDREKRGPLWNARRIWEAIAASRVPGLVLQDDVILHPQFCECLAEIEQHVIAGSLGAVMLLAPPRRFMEENYRDGYNFVNNWKDFWFPGQLFSPGFCARLLEWLGQHPRSHHHDDLAVNEFCRGTGTAMPTCLPSLVQHNLKLRSVLGTPAKIFRTRRESTLWTRVIPEGHFAKVRVAEGPGRPRRG